MIGGLRKTSLCLLAGVGAFGVLAFGGTSAQADSSVQALEAQMRAMQEQMKALQQQVQEAKQQVQEAKHASSGSGHNDLDLKVKWKGAPELSSRDGKFKFKVRGRLMVDYDGIDQDFAITGEDDVSAVELRRARLGVEGVLFYDFKYKFEIDFAGDSSEIKDAYIAYTNWANWEKNEIIIGNFKTANSMEQLTSSRFIMFLERAAYIDAFNLDRAIGGGVWAGDEHWSFQAGYYGAEAGDQETFFVDKTYATVRGTIAPINTDTTVVHVGGSYRARNAGTDRDGIADLFRYRARPDLHLADRFIATPFIGEADDMWQLEAAFVWNRFTFQGEFAQIDVDIPWSISNASPTYNGWFVQGSVFLTDDMRNYEADDGSFGRIKPNNPFFRDGSGFRGWGAWELAGRYDVVELADAATNITNSTVPNAVMCGDCGDQKAWTIGLNWWMTSHTALKFNYVNADISGGDNNGADIEGFAMRAQIDW